MQLKIAEARRYLASFDLQRLFVEGMGWDRANQTIEVSADGERFKLTAIAHKRGLAAYLCAPMPDGSIPPYALRAKIEAKVRNVSQEHLIIFADKDRTIQKWQWVRRQPGKPIARREYEKTEVILQRLQAMVFDLSEEEDLTIVEVNQRVRSALDVEKVTKKFYDRFKAEHAAFMKFIKGIPDEHLQRWYTSVTLNRLMFIYFIQKKQFLDKDPDYLRHHLEESKKQGKDKFYTDFLCPLFFEGFAKKKHSAEIRKLLGNVPYLNGGIFERHQIEELHGERIQIPDKAFEQLFDFFDEYRWHLDERPNKDDKEINPDVLGYIFEKYINQKQMGAYYTKEDITEYIAKNTIIPHLFDAAGVSDLRGLKDLGGLRGLLSRDPDRYIYAAVRYGVKTSEFSENSEVWDDLPAEIAVGLDDPKRREGWNKPAPAEFALPTEIWREVVARRRRYQEVKEKLTKGEVTSINDLITLNLDIRQFAQDVIEDSDADLLAAFWKALTQIKILDPTVGSGAFLFAALNVLEPLYEACLERMSALVEELDRSGEKHSPKKYEPFRKALEQVRQRPDEDYFIFKSIIINNLYGVDIMEEAVEICKLRLFLKLASQVEPDASKENLGIEPLPDIDFNIRAGNTLVGFATREDVKRSVQFGTVGGVQSEKLFAMPEEDAQLKRIEEKAEDVDRLYKLFRQQQTEFGGEVRPEDKRELQKRLGELEKELNILLAKQYGISLTPSPSPTGRGKSEGQGEGEAYKKWLESHTPFHWFVEFFGIMNEGGFDVIIGNPPYVENSKIKNEYSLSGYVSEVCGNLYTLILERTTQLANKNGRFGMIVPMSIVSTERMTEIRQILFDNMNLLYFSNYSGDAHPSVLFNGVKMRLTIIVGQYGKSSPQLFTTKFMRWLPVAREYLFDTISYAHTPSKFVWNGLIPKANDEIDVHILEKIFGLGKAFNRFVLPNSAHSVYAHRIVAHFVKCFDFIPYFKNERDGEKKSEDYKIFSFQDQSQALLASSFLNSSLFYYFYLTYSDAYHCGRELILGFPCNLDTVDGDLAKELRKVNKRLMSDLAKNSVRRKIEYHGTGFIEYDEFYPRLSKPIIDEIDRVLARHYGLSDEELDFIINYDIKYRMGASAGEEEDE